MGRPYGGQRWVPASARTRGGMGFRVGYSCRMGLYVRKQSIQRGRLLEVLNG